MKDTLTDTLIRHIESLGYNVNRMTLLLEGGERHRFTAWPATPDGVYHGGDQFVAEADDPYDTAVELAQLDGVDLVDG